MTVIGHQWWWEARYPGTTAVTANEIHIPTNTRIDVLLESTDVIHSFWVPALNKKMDMLPGHPNHLLLYSNRAGVFRGQCAEFCGLQHAHMALDVTVEDAASFASWRAAQLAPAAEPKGADAEAGKRVFEERQCATCHAIAGTAAASHLGPDLTHVASRRTIAAGALPFDRDALARWISDPQAIKPGANMPAVPLADSERAQVVDYLMGLE